MFTHYNNDLQNFVGNAGGATYFNNVSWRERVHSWKVATTNSLKSLTTNKPVMPVDMHDNLFAPRVAELVTHTFNDNILATWQQLYSQLRRPLMLSLFTPKSSTFHSYRSLKKYVTEYPTSRVAITFEFASQIREYERDPQHVITLSETSLTAWRNNQNLQTAITHAARNFSERIAMQPLMTHQVMLR